MFHVEARTDGQIRLENCGFGLDGLLMNNTGSASMHSPGSLSLILEHVTCLLGAPVIRYFRSQLPCDGPDDFGDSGHGVGRASSAAAYG